MHCITLTCNVYFMGERMHRARKARRLNNYSKFSSPSAPRKLREPFSILTSRPTRNKHPIRALVSSRSLISSFPPAFSDATTIRSPDAGEDEMWLGRQLLESHLISRKVVLLYETLTHKYWAGRRVAVARLNSSQCPLFALWISGAPPRER